MPTKVFLCVGPVPLPAQRNIPFCTGAQGLSAYLATCSLFPPLLCVVVLVHRICQFDTQGFCVVIICFKLSYVGLVRGIGGGGDAYGIRWRNLVENAYLVDPGNRKIIRAGEGRAGSG